MKIISARNAWALCVSHNLDLTLGQFAALLPRFTTGGCA